MVRSMLVQWRWIVTALIAASALHCGAAPEPTPGNGKKGGNGEGGPGDENGNGNEAEVCATWPESTSPFEIDPFGPAQVAVSAASDGEVLWVGYTRASNLGQGGIQVFAVRIDCDGAPGEPMLLSTSEGDPARGSPVIAIAGERVMVAWTENEPNLSRVLARYRVFDRSGEPLSSTDARFEPVINGEDRSGSFSNLSIAGWSDGFALAAEMNAPGFSSSRAVAQRLSPDGEAVGETLLVDHPLDMRAQRFPAVAVEPSGRLHLAWEVGDKELRRSTLEPTAETFSPRPSAPVLQDLGGQWPVAAASRDEDAAWFAFTSGTQIVVSDATRYGAASRVVLGEVNAAQLLPAVAAGANGGAVAWLRQSGGRYAVWAQRFAWSGTSLVTGTPIQVSSGAQSGILRPSITHLSGDTYFVAWIEGGGGEGKVMGRIVTLQ